MKRAALALLVACGASVQPIRSTHVVAPDERVVDLHVDLPHAVHAQHRILDEIDASPARLARGHVRAILAPLFTVHAYAMTPAEARAAYEQKLAASRAAFAAIAPTEAWLSFEGADGFADDPTGIDAWMARGACLVGLVHDHGNALGGASQDPSAEERARGLTDAGKALARHVVSRGGLLDLAHASDRTMDDLLAIGHAANAPLVDSHTGLRALHPSMRNIDDAHLRAVAASNGIAGISMHGGHIGKTPGQSPTLDDWVDAVMHAIEVAGIDHVAVGSDFDGNIDPPKDADGESVWPRARALLIQRGMRDEDVSKVFSGNALRVFGWAKEHGCAPGAR